MKLTKRQGRFLHKVIAKWREEGALTGPEADRLTGSFTVQSVDWRNLARYSFWIAIACLFISVCATVADDYIIRLVRRIFSSSDIALSSASGIVSLVFYSLGTWSSRRRPEKRFSNQALLLIGVLFTGGAIVYLGRALDNGSRHFSLLLLFATFIYGLVGLLVPSRMVWVFAILSLGASYGAEIGYRSGWGGYYMGMNYPLLYVIFGTGLVLISIILKYIARLSYFYKSTYKLALLYLFIALWMLSVFGRCGDLDHWYAVRQVDMLPWALLSGVVAVLAIIAGVRVGDRVSRGFGITFLLINLYTLYFEYLWNNMHKALFFFILALSFWFVGRWAERIWNLGKATETAGPLPLDEILEEE
jgi:hypothetical protein